MINVLIVDDQLSGLISLDDILSSLSDVEILKASSAKAAMKILLEQDIDCILLDVAMPVMDGFEFLKTLQHAPAHANIPVIMVTGKIFSENETLRAYSYGAVDFLLKPLDSQVVYRKVGFIVAQARRMKFLSSIEGQLNTLRSTVIQPLQTITNSLDKAQQEPLDMALTTLNSLDETWLSLKKGAETIKL